MNYLPTKLGAYICLHAVNMSSNELAKFSQSMGYISAVGLGVSIACLLLHLAVFFLLPEMRNLSGKNLACLSISLLVAYLSFIAGQVGRYSFSKCMKGSNMKFVIYNLGSKANILRFYLALALSIEHANTCRTFSNAGKNIYICQRVR